MYIQFLWCIFPSLCSSFVYPFNISRWSNWCSHCSLKDLNHSLKKLTIPQLELLGAVILSRLVNTVTSSLSCKCKSTYWVYSQQCYVYWIRYEKPWKQYVKNHLQEICHLTCKEDWRHCPAQLNPADLPTWGLEESELAVNILWWSGPQLLSPVGLHTYALIPMKVFSELCKQQTDVSHTIFVLAEDLIMRID